MAPETGPSPYLNCLFQRLRLFVVRERLSQMLVYHSSIERLGDERGLIWHVPWLGFYIAAGNHDFNMWPVLIDMAGQLEAVATTRHLYVTEEQDHAAMMFVQERDSGIPIIGLMELKASLLKDVTGIHENDRIVVYDEGVRGRRLFHPPTTSRFGGSFLTSQKQWFVTEKNDPCRIVPPMFSLGNGTHRSPRNQ